METKLFIDSFNRAKATRQKAVLPTTIFHFDLGLQYLSDQFREVIRISQVSQSMGAIGDSYDNAMAISLWANTSKKGSSTKKRSKHERRPKLKYLIGSIGITTDDDILASVMYRLFVMNKL